jgi:hypothetical protein
MKIYFGGAIILLIAVFFSSCQKEIDWKLTNKTQNDSIYLKQYIELDTTLPVGLDTSLKYIFTYDSQKRLKQWISIEYYFGYINTVESFYNGNDTLPYKIVSLLDAGLQKIRDTTFLFFVNGLVSYDSTIEYDITTSNQFMSTVAVSYQQDGNNTFISCREFALPGAAPVISQWSGTVFKTYLNGNIATQDDTSNYHIGFTDRYHMEALYDNKINPFYNLQGALPVLQKNYLQKNNAIEMISKNSLGVTEVHDFYGYTYRADGYPLVARGSSILSPGYSVKGLYFYTD